MICNELGQRDEAIADCRAPAIESARLRSPYNTIAVALTSHWVGWTKRSRNARRSSELSPTASPHHSNLLYMLNYHPSSKDERVFAEHRRWGQHMPIR